MAGIYIHIPFCKQACTYCNFHFSTSLTLRTNLLRALKREIVLTGKTIDQPQKIETVYIGGGTPSLLDPQEIEAILGTVRQHFSLLSGAEISLEANPDDIKPTVLEQWLQSGINRLSLGIQSFNEQELRWMNRAHTAVESLDSIDLILAAGFSNFSVDLIYGSPMLTNDEFIKNVTTVIDKTIPHISAYALTVEPKTALHKMIRQSKSAPVNEGRQADQFDILVSMLEAAGYEQYEISNFAMPGFRSRHNSSYWLGKPYYGFGPSAHSYDGKSRRRWNVSNNARYIQSIEKGLIPFEEELLTPVQQLNETVMISLRTMEGLDMQIIKEEFGEDFVSTIMSAAQKHIAVEKLVHIDSKLMLTKKGKFFADGIASDLFF